MTARAGAIAAAPQQPLLVHRRAPYPSVRTAERATPDAAAAAAGRGPGHD